MFIVSEIQGWLTVYEAARIIGKSHAQVTRYVAKGLLPAKRIGQSIMIREEDARSFVPPKRGNPRLLAKI